MITRISSSEIRDYTITNEDIAPSANISDTKLAQISTPGKVLNSATTATSNNVANTIVLRDNTGSVNLNNVTALNIHCLGTFFTSSFTTLDLTVSNFVKIGLGSQYTLIYPTYISTPKITVTELIANTLNAGVIDTIGATNKIRFDYATEAALPDAASYPGMFAYVRDTESAYYAKEDDTWIKLASTAVFTGPVDPDAGTSGLVPAPDVPDELKYLRGDATWANIPVLIGATDLNDGTSGLVPQPVAGDENKVLKGNGTWETISNLVNNVVLKDAGEANSYTVTMEDETILIDATDDNFTLNLPEASTVQFKKYNIKKIDSTGNIVTIDADGTQKIDNNSTLGIDTQYVCYTIQSDGSNWWII